MKTILLLYSVIYLFILPGCKKDSPTEPHPTKPPGYQEDIPWPSLADGPWPMLGNNPQSNGRSKYLGPTSGIIEWRYRYPWNQILSSIAVGPDSTIYAPFETGGLIALDSEGSLKWKVLEEITQSPITPIITSEGNILNFAKTGVYLISNAGSILWYYPVDIDAYGANIDKEGNIYFITQHKLTVLNNKGTLLWTYSNPKLEGECYSSFSPDGKTLYIPGNINTPAVIAFDIVNKKIKWEFGSGSTKWCVVDSDGNIYLTALLNSTSANYALVCLTSEGTVRWSREYLGYIAKPALDKNGNIYFASDSLYSLDYFGEQRWAHPLSSDGIVSSPLVSNTRGNIYVTYEKHEAFDLEALDHDGNQLYFMTGLQGYPGQTPAIGFNRLIIPTGKGEFIYSVK